MPEWITEEMTDFQILLADAFEDFRKITRRRNPSDADFARWLGVKPGTFNTWVNENRTPDLGNVIILKQRLGYKVFDVLGMKRVYVPDDPKLVYVIEKWDRLSDNTAGRKLKEQILELVDANIETGGKNGQGDGDNQ